MGEKRSREQVIGLTLQLQKFGVGKVRDKHDTQANTILGHYDHLVIRKIKRWLEYSPRMDWESPAEGTAGQPAKLPATHYPIKLLFPCEDESGRLPEFSYDDWKHHEDLLEENACMTVVLLNLTDAYKAQVDGDLLGAFLQLLKNSCDAALLSEVHCCVLPSLGYSDFCILMADRSWDPALRLVEHLHSLTVRSPKKDVRIPVLSTDYMMPVCHPKAGTALDEKFSNSYFNRIELTVRVHLCPGVTVQQLADDLKDIQVYRTSGGSDCLLWAKAKQAQALMGVLMGDTKRNIVIDMASTPQLRVVPSQQKIPRPLPLMCVDDLTQDSFVPDASGQVPHSFHDETGHFKAAIQRYAEALRLYNRHNRQASALQELTAVIEDVCMQPHTGSLRNLMKNLIGSFSSCLERCADDMSQPDLDFNDMEEFVSEFSSIVGRFLEDLSRSDCFFMDREKYNHASVSSATSLLISYNQWLNEFTDAIRSATQEENRSHYSFLVTCGGRDQTQTTNAFYFLKPNTDKDRKDQLYENLPLVIQMSEMSLFDFSGTILRAFHECMHYIGSRRRRDRLHHFLDFVISILSLRISCTLLEDESYQRTEYVLTRLEGPPELLHAVKEAHQETLNALAKNISQFLWAYFPESERATWDEADYLSENIQIWAYEHLMIAFSGHMLEISKAETPELLQNNLAAGIYDKTMEARQSFRQRCGELCLEHGVPTVIFDFGAQKLDVLKEADYSPYHRADAMLSCQIQMVLARLLISQPSAGMPMSLDESDPSCYEEWNRQFPYVMLVPYNISNVLLGATDIFSEAFADISACTILDVDLEDYLLMHVYEDWDLNSALSLDEMSMAYRIPSVLRLCFSDSLDDRTGRLTPEARGRVKMAIARLVAHGMPDGRLDVDQLCDRVDQLLTAFSEAGATGAPLLDYLSLCRQDYQAPKVKKTMRKFSEAFQKIRLIAVDPEGEDLHKKLVEMHHALYDGWRDHHAERTNQL